MSWQGVTKRLAPASKEEQRGQHVPGLLNGVYSDVTHQLSRAVVKLARIHGLDQRKLSDQLPDLGSRDALACVRCSAQRRDCQFEQCTHALARQAVGAQREGKGQLLLQVAGGEFGSGGV